ncbi:MAG TPA: hypothetical protein VIG32_05945 [Candidatus Baltobacteraceae bacterium]
MRVTVEQIADMALIRDEPLASMFTLSPFVWKRERGYDLLVRAVNRSEIATQKVARIYYGHSQDGIVFTMDEAPALAPGPQPEDRDGCEDPTADYDAGTLYVYYTGWNQALLAGQLMLAVGPDGRHLQKRGVSIPWTQERKNPKEATLVRAGDGTWRLFFEYAAGEASKIGIARSKRVDGPWEIQPDLFSARPDLWDRWHLSTGPIEQVNGVPTMFYNGATHDAKWRIGWITFDDDYTRVVDRCVDPVIVPPPPDINDTDIAFAASALEMNAGTVWLYYSISDQYMKRATLRVS